MKDTLTHIDPIKAMHTGVVTIDHLNVFVLIAACIAFLGILVFVLFHSKALITHISESLKDPKSGAWSPKILTAFMVSSTIFLAHITWLKYAYVANDFSQLQPILIIDYAYIVAAFGMKMAEKMQAKSIDSKDANNNPPTA